VRPRLVITLAGFCAALTAADVRAQTPGDPYEAMNRRFYAGAIHVDQTYFRPVVRIYQALTPGPIGIAIHNMIVNIGEPVAIINDALQGRPRPFGRDAVRFVADSTVGIGGMIDVAGMHGLPHHDNDFGVTLGVWGVGPGPYLFVPLLGPSTVRDSIGAGIDVLLSPFTYLRFPGRLTLQYSTLVVGTLDRRASTQGQLEAITADAADPYATLRSVYLQSREAQVRGDDATPELPPIDDPEPAPAAAPPPGADAAPFPARMDAPVTQEAAASDPDAPIATAFACDTAGSAPRYLAAN
jgi:phospholipid-binding lipoprotein MlaA